MNEIRSRVKQAMGVYESILASSSALRSGKIWCWTCGRSEDVDSALCLRTGWPKCCKGTMSLDMPPGTSSERAVDEAWERNK